jgi:hypothetical protein
MADPEQQRDEVPREHGEREAAQAAWGVGDVAMTAADVDVVDERVDGAVTQVQGPKSPPTNGRIETSTDSYAVGAPPIDTNSWTVREARRRRAEARSS